MNHFVRVSPDMMVNVSHVTAVYRQRNEAKTPVLSLSDGDEVTITEKAYGYFQSITQDIGDEKLAEAS